MAARKFTGKDVSSWKVVNFSGKTLRGEDGKLLNSFDGYASAQPVAKKLGGTAVRA